MEWNSFGNFQTPKKVLYTSHSTRKPDPQIFIFWSQKTDQVFSLQFCRHFPLNHGHDGPPQRPGVHGVFLLTPFTGIFAARAVFGGPSCGDDFHQFHGTTLPALAALRTSALVGFARTWVPERKKPAQSQSQLQDFGKQRKGNCNRKESFPKCQCLLH